MCAGCSTGSRRRYDAANRVMSAGIDVLWRKKAIRWLAQGQDAGRRRRASWISARGRSTAPSRSRGASPARA